MTSAEFVITRLDTRALQAMREVGRSTYSLDDYALEQPTNVLPRSPPYSSAYRCGVVHPCGNDLRYPRSVVSDRRIVSS